MTAGPVVEHHALFRDHRIAYPGPWLERALAELWSDVPTQRCTVHKHRNLLAHAPERLRDEVTADYNDMIYAASADEIERKRKAFLRKWRLRCQAIADCLEEAGDRLFAFTKLPDSQWKSTRTTNAIDRLHEEFKRRIKTQTVLPSAETAAMMFWALVASGQISMRKVDGWKTLAVKPADLPFDPLRSARRKLRQIKFQHTSRRYRKEANYGFRE